MTGLKLEEEFLQLKELTSIKHGDSNELKKVWERCKLQVSSDPQQISQLDQWLDIYNGKAFELRQSYNDLLRQFTEFFRDVPFVTVFGRWLQSMMVDEFWRNKYLDGMKRLLEKKLIPFTTMEGEPLTLASFKLYGHQNVIENIRCIKEWSVGEKEAIVQSYMGVIKSPT